MTTDHLDALTKAANAHKAVIAAAKREAERIARERDQQQNSQNPPKR